LLSDSVFCRSVAARCLRRNNGTSIGGCASLRHFPGLILVVLTGRPDGGRNDEKMIRGVSCSRPTSSEAKDLLADLCAVEDTVRARVLYDHAGSPPAEARGSEPKD